MKTAALLILAATLTACGGEMPIEQPPDATLTAGTVSSPETAGTCTTKAVRSESGSYTIHSTDGGVTWKHGQCPTP